ncbi:MAG: hypothetical protein SGI74_13495 [Oligoflexia bacterium]|nr:hypothetical protein [Oligoflexia bacterium]
MKIIYFLSILALQLTLLLGISAHARDVELSWDPMTGAAKYEIQISDTTIFEKPLSTTQLDKPSYQTQLNIGQYYYRVRVIDIKGKGGKWSPPTPLNVTPYAPELIELPNGFETAFYEVPPELSFSWKKVEGDPEYEILIYKSTGQKVLEEPVKGENFKTSKVTEGEYLWKVRSIVNKTLVSPYCEPRHFTISRKTLTPPELITPVKDGTSPAYREVKFTWKQDPAAKYSDLYFEKISGKDGAKPFKRKISNLTESAYTADYEEPGKYKWTVTTKQDKETPGVSAPFQDFEVRNDVMSKGNYEFEFSLSPVSDLYAITSARQTRGVTGIAQESKSNGLFYGFLGGYYFTEVAGLFFSTRTGSQTVENITAYAQESDLSFRARFGSKGFNQEFWFGYRMMDIISAENTPTTLLTNFTTFGGLVGTRINATVYDGWRASLSGFYYKPTGNIEGFDGLVADVYGASLGVKWNFMYQFWLGYKYSFERVAATFTSVNQASSVNSTWTMYRSEPFFLSISFEH